MESLKTALPSITTMISGNSSKSAGEDDTSAINAAASTGPSAKLDPKSESAALVPHPEAPPTRLGQIGQGKGTPLSRSQRRRALKAERFRQPLIRADPAFAANPFGTIRTHAQNTLVPHPATT
jgi:hypothetical protein